MWWGSGADQRIYYTAGRIVIALNAAAGRFAGRQCFGNFIRRAFRSPTGAISHKPARRIWGIWGLSPVQIGQVELRRE